MSTTPRLSALLCAGLWIGSGAVAHSQEPSPAAAVARPKFGTQSPTTVVLGASKFRGYAAFDPLTFSLAFYTCPPEDCPPGTDNVLATLTVPAGAVITSIGVNTATMTDVPMSFSLYSRDHLGHTADLGSFSIPTHAGFGTDYFDIDDVLVPSNSERVLMVVVRSPRTVSDFHTQFFGYAEVAWRLTVSEPAETPIFGDVPVTHPFRRFIEALARSGITGGCGGGNYCPEASLTRGQMAAFLSKALGLHWPL
jgi:hypothetical protein